MDGLDRLLSCHGRLPQKIVRAAGDLIRSTGQTLHIRPDSDIIGQNVRPCRFCHLTDARLPGKEIPRYDGRHLVSCLGNSFFHNPIVSTENHNSFFVNQRVDGPLDRGDPCNGLFEFPHPMQRLGKLVPPGKRCLSYLLIRQSDVLDCIVPVFFLHITFFSFPDKLSQTALQSPGRNHN